MLDLTKEILLWEERRRQFSVMVLSCLYFRWSYHSPFSLFFTLLVWMCECGFVCMHVDSGSRGTVICVAVVSVDSHACFSVDAYHPYVLGLGIFMSRLCIKIRITGSKHILLCVLFLCDVHDLSMCLCVYGCVDMNIREKV